MSTLYLREQDFARLLALLAQYLPNVTAWAYGSRINGTAHEASDLDVVLRSPNLSPIPNGLVAAFVEAVQASQIPIVVDVRDWARLPEAFCAEILRQYVVLREGQDE